MLHVHAKLCLIAACQTQIQMPCTRVVHYLSINHGHAWSSAAVHLHEPEACLVSQLLKNLQRSIQTLEICGEWNVGGQDEAEATLEMRTDRIWMQGRAPQKQLSALQVRQVVL